MRHDLNIEGQRLVALEFNPDKPGLPVIFIHGISSSVNFWVVGQTPIITERCHWYSLSLPGHYPAAFPPDFRREDLTPDMMVRVLAAAIRQLVGEQKVIIIGHSTGGFSAVALAARVPELVEAAVSVSGFAEGKWTGILALQQGLARSGPVGEALMRLNFKLMALNLPIFKMMVGFYTADRQAFYGHPATNTALKNLLPDTQHLDTYALGHYFNRMPDINITDWLSAITAPVLVMAGDQDPIVPPAQAKLIAECVPNSRLVMLSGAGHVPMTERSQQYIDLITEFMEPYC